MKVMLFKKSRIRVDEEGRVCLNDIHKAAGFSKNQRPSDWLALRTTSKAIEAVLARITGKSGNWAKSDYRSALYTKTGQQGGSWAHENLALAYAEYLAPKLGVEIRDVFLRYKKADAELADDILDRATPEENEWAAVRALSRVKRNEFTTTLQEHGVEGFGYANCTDTVYKEVLDGTAKKLKEARGLDKKANLRNSMSTDELVSVMFAETLSRQRITEERSRGNSQCIAATKRSSVFVRQAIEGDRKDRQRPLV